MKRSELTSRGNSKQLIVASTREEIKKNGILGLRVADVAEGAHCSITQIYRFFGDRDGLLAQVLGDMYDEIISDAFDSYMKKIREVEVITLDDIVNFMPLPSHTQSMQNQEIRMQILATSVNNVQLRQRIEAATKTVYAFWQQAIEEVNAKLPPGVRIDWRVVNIMLLVQNMYYRTLLGDEGFTDEEYRQFLKDKFIL